MKSLRVKRVSEILQEAGLMDQQDIIQVSEIIVEALTPRDPIVAKVTAQFEERSNVGLKKYNTSLFDANLSVYQWMEHLKQELMDATNYVQCIQDQNKSIELERLEARGDQLLELKNYLHTDGSFFIEEEIEACLLSVKNQILKIEKELTENKDPYNQKLSELI